MSKEKTEDNPVYAGPASKDSLVKFHQDAINELRKAGIKMKDKMDIVLGVKKWPSLFQHRAVILKCVKREKCAFRLELEIDTPQDCVTYIRGSFSCPDVKCRYEEKAFTELVNHHLCYHVNQGEDVHHKCCGEEFHIFELFAQHVYKNHRDLKGNVLRLKYEQITPEKFDKFLSQDSVKFYPMHQQETSFQYLLHLAEKIMLGFDRYWIFMWNCQDFAAWFLCTVGIPLRLIDPTSTDNLTGSGTDSSARKVQQRKASDWYKKPENLKIFDSEILGKAIRTCVLCPHLPPLTKEAFDLHEKFAHMNEDDQESNPLQMRENEIFHHLCGVEYGLCLELEPTRKWELYRLRGTSVNAHTSLVVRPWIVSDDCDKTSLFASDLFVLVEKRLDSDNSSFLYVNPLDGRHVSKLERICEIKVSILELVDYISLVFSYMHSHGMAKNCVAFVYYLSTILHKDKMADRGVFIVDSQYTRHRSFLKQRLAARLEKELDVNWGVEDIHSTVGSQTLSVHGRVALLMTLMHRMYNTMTSIHVMFLLVLTHYDTIGQCIFPLIFLFTLYFVYALVFSNYRKFGSRWTMLHSVKKWNTEIRLRILQDALHVISMCFMTYEVALDLDRLQSMILIQLLWLNCVFDSREMENKCQSLQKRFKGAWKPGFVHILKDNIHRKILRVLLLTTFLLPVKMQVSFIVVEFLIMTFFFVTLLLSYAYQNYQTERYWAKVFLFVVNRVKRDADNLDLKHVTGHKNLEFQLAFFIFMLTMSGYISYSGYYVHYESSVSNMHIFLLVSYSAISFHIDLKDVSQKFSQAMDENPESTRRAKFSRLRKILVVLRLFIIISPCVLTLGATVLILILDFKAIVVSTVILMYVHFIIVGVAFDMKDVLLSIHETL